MTHNTIDPEIYRIAIIRIMTAQLILSISISILIIVGYILQHPITFYLAHTTIIITTIITTLIHNRMRKKIKEDQKNGTMD